MPRYRLLTRCFVDDGLFPAGHIFTTDLPQSIHWELVPDEPEPEAQPEPEPEPEPEPAPAPEPEPPHEEPVAAPEPEPEAQPETA